MSGPEAGVVPRLREASAALAGLSDDELLDRLAGALARFDDAERQGLAEELAAHTGSSTAMLRFGLDRAFAAHDRAGLAAWLAAARRESGETANRPRVVLQVLAGNVGLLALPAMLEALLARAAVILKPATGDPVTPRRLAAVLAAHDPRLGAAVAVQSWRGGDRDAEAPLLEVVDAVVAAGGEGLAADLPGRVTSPLLLRGPRVSIGLLGPEAGAGPDRLDAVVRETVLWEQRGCLSPVVLLTAHDPAAVAEGLAAGFRRYETRWPAAPRDEGTAREVRGFRARYEMAEPKVAGLHADDSTAWTVVWDREPGLTHGPAARVLRVAPLPEPGALAECLQANRDRLQAVGHVGLDAPRRSVLDEEPDLHRPPLDRIQDPPAGWRADGRSALAELLRVEPTEG